MKKKVKLVITNRMKLRQKLKNVCLYISPRQLKDYIRDMHPIYSFSMQHIKPSNTLCSYISWLLKQMLVIRYENVFGFSNIQSFRILGLLKLAKEQYVSKI